MKIRVALHAPLLLALSVTSTPVERVVHLLQDLETKLKSDASNEGMLYDKYACWCEKSSERKADAITDGKADIRRLGQDILTHKGTVATKVSEIETTLGEIKTDEEALETMTSVRQKENQAYMTERAEMSAAITSLESAVTVLGAATGFLQSDATGAGAAKVGGKLAAVEDALLAMPTHTLERLAKHGLTAKLPTLSMYAKQLSQAKSKHAGATKYDPQSGTIAGILKEMYNTFAADLETMNSDEADKNSDYETLYATKAGQLEQRQKKVKDAEKAKAEAEVSLAEATEEFEATEEQLQADVDFFDTMKEACENKSTSWTERKRLRDGELAAVQQAITTLQSDQSRELFGKAFATKTQAAASFLQLAGSSSGGARGSDEGIPALFGKVYQVLKSLATKTQSLRLARLAVQTHRQQVGHFDQVIQSIDTLVTDIKTEQTEDDDKQKQCKEEYTKIESVIKDKTWKIEVNDAKINRLEDKIEALEEEKAQTLKAINNTNDELTELTTQRTSENEAYNATKKDNEDAIDLLNTTKTALAKFYEDESIELGPLSGGEGYDLLQAAPEFERSADDAPEAAFSEKGKRKNMAKGVLSLMQAIIEDLEVELAVALRDETAAQEEYEKQKKANRKLHGKLLSKKTTLDTAITTAGGDKDTEEQDKIANEADLTAEKDYEKEITPDCDFILKHFAERAEKRTTEIDGLFEAKAYLSGYRNRVEKVLGGAALFQSDHRSRVSKH